MIEASPLTSDNDWVLNVAAKYPIIVGMVGDLVPGTASTMAKDLGPAAREPALSRYTLRQTFGIGILAIDMLKPGFLPGLKMLAERGLALDSANPGRIKLVQAIASVTNRVPELRIVIDHLPTYAGSFSADRARRLLGRCCGNLR